MLQAVRDSTRPSMDNLQGQSRRYRSFLQQWEQLYVRDGLLYHQSEDNDGKREMVSIGGTTGS